MHVLIRDKTFENSPEIVSELEVNSNDVIPQVGDKVSHHVEKLGFQDAQMDVVRTFDVVERNFYIGDKDSDRPRLSVDIEVVNDGTEVEDFN